MQFSVIFAIFAIALTNLVSGDFITTAPFYGQQYTMIGGPRGLYVDETGDLLVVSQRASGITAVYENPGSDGTVEVIQTSIVNAQGLNLNHGIAYNKGFLYASSTTTVYRWPYTPGQRSEISTLPTTVIQGMPSGGHNTRTLAFNAQGVLYVSVGSNQNVDDNSDRARIRRFSLDTLPIDFNSGEVFADGLRNEVGLAFDEDDVLWGVENGCDELNRPDLGGDIHNGNPAEEMNRFDQAPGTHYGYPYCFSTYNLTGYAPGTQFAHPQFMPATTDEWCQNPANNKPPALSMPAHNAPLGIEFYKGQNCDGEGAFPCSARGDAIVPFHGSWNSDIPTGYRVAWVPFNNSTGLPEGDTIDIIKDADATTCGSCFRPVNAVFNHQGHLIISADATSELYKVTYGTPPPLIRAQKQM